MLDDDKIICDLCKTSETSSGTTQRPNWGNSYSYHFTEVHSNSGWGGDDGGAYRTETFHICPKCWEGMLVPWMNLQNAEATIREEDW